MKNATIRTSRKLHAGSELPAYELPRWGGGSLTLGERLEGAPWQLIFVYRGLHCPLCKRYLGKLEKLRERFREAGAEIVAVSGDPEERAGAMVQETGVSFPVGHSLDIGQMEELGLYISHPRSEQETDRPFAEPAMFALNEENRLHLIDISNTPFNRSDLEELVETVEWIRENNYPIRGTYA
ncbi:MAG: peroxiredoxin-like family protein [Puniceicoccaceae bacterium]